MKATLIILAAGIGFIILFLVQTFRAQSASNPNQKQFLKGKVQKPDGSYKGSAIVRGPWRGKTFDAKKSTGANILEINGKKIERFPFKTYTGRGIWDKDTSVLKIDYNLPQNPFILRTVLDEIVEVAPGKYLGKAHLRIIPGFPFTVVYFRLEK